MGLFVQRQDLLSPEIHRAGHHAIVKLSGELDASTAGLLYSDLAELARHEVNHVALDLTELTFVDSGGLSAIVAEHKRCEALGGELIILTPQHNVRRVFELTGLADVFDIRPKKGDGPS